MLPTENGFRSDRQVRHLRSLIKWFLSCMEIGWNQQVKGKVTTPSMRESAETISKIEWKRRSWSFILEQRISGFWTSFNRYKDCTQYVIYCLCKVWVSRIWCGSQLTMAERQSTTWKGLLWSTTGLTAKNNKTNQEKPKHGPCRVYYSKKERLQRRPASVQHFKVHSYTLDIRRSDNRTSPPMLMVVPAKTFLSNHDEEGVWTSKNPSHRQNKCQTEGNRKKYTVGVKVKNWKFKGEFRQT